MKAKETFEKLGYTFSYNYNNTAMTYIKETRQWREEGRLYIEFDLESEDVSIYFEGYISGNLPAILTPKEIEIIYEQCKELGWLED